ncbi:TetR/AcrR family transcriptional regulator [Nonomuraea sp. NPDC000554]|uniref:TetR/AcrR family transcriptional regulator n=1 Tax=Nonomuraea sp. NPDC000554 TaxID=3154259 RepID=UPI00331FAE70
MKDVPPAPAPPTGSRHRGGRPPRISREQILRAAERFAPEDLSMSSLAAALGVTHSALYNYFPSRSALLAAITAEAAGRLEIPSPDDRSWQEWLVEAAFAHRSLFMDHLGSLDAVTAKLTAMGAPLLETFTTVLSAAGFTPEQANDAFQLFSACCLGSAVTARRRPHFKGDDASAYHAWLDNFGISEDSPIRAYVPVWIEYDVDRGFQRNIETVIDGLSASLAADRAATPAVR